MTCGTAQLLEQLSPRFSESVIGFTFLLQHAIVACVAGFGGSLADAQERKYCSWGWGRLKVLVLAMSLGTLAFFGHCLPGCVSGIFPNNNSALLLAWHIIMRLIYAVSFGVMAPCLDGLSLAHLDCMKGASTSDFGKERIYGALWWSVGSLASRTGIDWYGFDVMYALLGVSILAFYISMVLYLWGLNRDTTGDFKPDGLTDVRRLRNSNGQQHKSNATSENDVVLSNSSLLRMVVKPRYGRAFLFGIFLLAMGLSVDNSASIFFDGLGASSTWMEIPVYYVAPFILKRYGPSRLLITVGVAYVICVVGYTLVADEMVFVLILETLHAIFCAGFNVGSVEFIAGMIPEGHESAGQGILIAVTYFGIVARLIFARWIQQSTLMAMTGSIGCVVLLVAELFHEKERPRSKNERLDALEEKESDESCGLIKSDSLASSGSDFADGLTEGYLKKLKYDSLQKYVKDW